MCQQFNRVGAKAGNSGTRRAEQAVCCCLGLHASLAEEICPACANEIKKAEQRGYVVEPPKWTSECPSLGFLQRVNENILFLELSSQLQAADGYVSLMGREHPDFGDQQI